jgi:hypothetical protein
MFFLASKYYDSIDNCPVLVFHEIMNGGDLKKLKMKGRFNGKKALESWKKIFNQYIKEFGLPENYKTYLEKMSQAAGFWAKSIDDKFNKNMARIKEAEAKKALNDGAGGSFNDLVANVSKKMGFRVAPNEITVREFYSYVNG